VVYGGADSSELRKAAPLYNRITICNSHPERAQYRSVDVKERIEKPETPKTIRMDQHLDQDSDNEDDPTKLLNQWLGELNTLKRGLDSGVRTGNNPPTPAKPVLRSHENRLLDADKKQQYRCSLINLDTSQDDELDAILGELTVLESQFDQEIQTEKRGSMEQKDSCGDSALSPASDRSSSNMTDLGIHSATHSRSSSGSDEIKQAGQMRKVGCNQRTDSPDTDSAFCDNLSVLSSCSTASSSKTGQSCQLPSSVPQLSKEEQEARIKAEKIKIAIEKIKEASVKKLFIKVFTCDGSAKSLLVDEKMTVGHVTRILAEKNHVSLDPKWALVELVPDLYMERVYEDNELLVENCLLWKVDSKNTLWFIERPEKFDLFSRPEVYLLGSSSSQKDDQMEEHSRQELLEEYFSSSGVGAPQLEGYVWLKADSKKSWKKYYFILRTSGLYYAPKGKKTSKDLVCLTTFDVNQVYYGVGWKAKYKAPTEFCFGIKHPQIQAKNPKYIKYLCVDTQKELHQWVTGIRIAKNGRNLFDNYRGIVEEITHADIDILTSKRFSVNSTNGLKILTNSAEKSQGDEIPSQVLTPSSENKSLASALSSGIESDMSHVSSSKSRTSEQEPSQQVNVSGDNSAVGTIDRASGLTPVGTLERGFNLRRSFSRSSRSSSSSGCLSDKSSGFELGFESDFPVGGTIKKRPTATARLPLTSTTWGLVRETDQEMEVENGAANVSLGAGGTLLRKAVRNSLSKKSLDNENVHQQRSTDELSAESCNGNSFVVDGDTAVSTDTAHEDILSSAFERSMSCMLEDESLPLPPPPRVDSVSSLDDIDQLPPPPPDMCYNNTPPAQGYMHRTNLQPNAMFTESNHYHVSPVTSPNVQSKPFPPSDQQTGCHPITRLPPPCPSNKSTLSSTKGAQNSAMSTLKKSGTLQKSSRRISFDDHVQMIDAPTSPGAKTPKTNIPKYSPAAPIRHNPKKLSFGQDSNDNYNSLPRSFLDNLQKVMSKKWQVAEKCRANEETTPHEVLGFRDEPINKVGQPNLYSKNSSIGAWVLETQMYAHAPQYYEEGNQDQHIYESQRQHQQQLQYEHFQGAQYQVENAQPYGQYVHVPEIGGYDQYETYGQFTHQPVVLREPEPTYVDPSRLRANKNKRPPPPPKRSENTQLSNSNAI
jgi:amyloid beta A4 precursor protein-binding family B protein 1-interacting protein